MKDEEFETYMASVDARLKQEGVAIHARPFLALSMAAKDLKRSIMMGDPFAERMHCWFKTMYGERLKSEMSLGQSVVLVMDDPYPIRLPVIYGAVRVDPLNWVEGLTPALLVRLGGEGADQIRAQIFELYGAYNLKGHMPAHARSWMDVDNAVESILGRPPHYGISRFSSLQVAEKALKGFIREHGGKPPTDGRKGHDLRHLQEMAQGLSIPRLVRRIEIPSSLIDPVICSAGVRYPEDTSTLEQAVVAHHTSMSLCAFLVSHANFISQR